MYEESFGLKSGAIGVSQSVAGRSCASLASLEGGGDKQDASMVASGHGIFARKHSEIIAFGN